MNLETFIVEAVRNRLFVFQDVTAAKNGSSAPYYADLRALYTYPALLRFAADWCADALAPREFAFVCGVETASLPLVGALAYAHGLPALYLRTKLKGYGLNRRVEGHFAPGDSVYLIDDLSVTAPESLEFTDGAESYGLHVKGLIVLFEKLRPAVGRDVFLERGYEYQCMFTYEDLAATIETHAAALGLDPALAGLVRDFANNV